MCADVSLFNRCTGPVYDTTAVGFDEPPANTYRAPNFAPPRRPTPDIRRAGNDPSKIAFPTTAASRTPSFVENSNPRAAFPIFPANSAAERDVPTQAVARVKVPAPGH